MNDSMQSYVDAYEHTVRSLLEVLARIDDDEWQLPTECPGWCVADQVAHVLALERQFLGDTAPPANREYADHVTTDYDKHMEDGVLAWRGTAPEQLTKELATTLEERLAGLRDDPPDPDGTTTGVLGDDVPVARFWPVRVFDLWAHEQDVRRAVQRPGNLGGPGAAVTRDQLLAALPYVIGKRVAPPAGTVVAFDVTGVLASRLSVTVGEDGRATASSGLVEDSTTTIRLDWETFSRLACGRIDMASAAYTIEGDLPLGREVLAALQITP
jgi:uncharacterized protein (TIGR03083 family)